MAKKRRNGSPETYSTTFGTFEEGIISVWTKEEDYFDDGEVDEDDIAVTGTLRLEEFDRIGAERNCIADEREVRCCCGYCSYGGRFEEVVNEWKKEQNGGKEKVH